MKKGPKTLRPLFIWFVFFAAVFVPYLRNGCAHGFDLGVLLEDFVAHFTAPAGLFVAAERKRGVEHVVAIDPHGTGAEQARQPMCFFDVASPYSGGEAVVGVISLRGDFLNVTEGNGGDDGPENFFAHHFHVFICVYEDGWLYEIALVTFPGTAGNGFGAFGQARFQVAANAIQLLLGNEWTHVARRIHAGTHVDVAGILCNTVDNLVENIVFDEQARTCAAALPLVEENRAGRAGNRGFYIRIIQHDVGRFSAQLQRNFFQISGGGFQNCFPALGGSVNRAFVGVRVRGRGRARRFSIAGNDVYNAVGN